MVSKSIKPVEKFIDLKMKNLWTDISALCSSRDFSITRFTNHSSLGAGLVLARKINRKLSCFASSLYRVDVLFRKILQMFGQVFFI